MKLEFKPEDFRIGYVRDGTTPSKVFEAYAVQAAEDANARLAEMLAEAPVVYADRHAAEHWDDKLAKFRANWRESDVPMATHRARLVQIEGIDNEAG